MIKVFFGVEFIFVTSNSIVLIDYEVFVFAMKVHRLPSIPVVASALFVLVVGWTTLWTILFYDH